MILVTNDDGIVAPGIKALVDIMREIDDILVVAPDSPQSGQGHAITLNRPLRLRKVNVFDGIEAYECSGTPVDCVKLAKNVLLKDKNIDLCVSGINHGSNASINIIYSGTMSAAMEASLENVPSIGFSLLEYGFDADFAAAKIIVKKIVESFRYKNDSPCRLLNVNIPYLPIDQIKGVKVCHQGNANWVEEFQEGIDPRGEKYYWLTGKFVSFDSNDADNDVNALANGYVSVVPSGHDLTYKSQINYFKYLEKI